MSLSKPQHFWRTLAGYFLLAVLGPGLCAAVLILRVPDQVSREMMSGMRDQAQLLAAMLGPALGSGKPVDLDQIKAIGEMTGTFRFTLATGNGRVIGDSSADPDGLENILNRPEIQLALSRGEGEAERFSPALGSNFFYVALPVGGIPHPLGFVRVGVTAGEIDIRIAQRRAAIRDVSVMLMLLLAVVAAWMAWSRAEELDVLTEVTEGLAQGDFDKRVMESRVPGLKRLADAINQMARNSARRVSVLTADRNRLATIFTGMVEGVIDVDQNQNIIHINDAAAQLVGIRKESCIGKPVWQELRDQAVTEALDEAIKGRGVIRIQVEYARERDQLVMDVYIASLSDDQGKPIGAVLVLHDITDLKHLERIRTDFVANASHELKTPITAIRGLSETVVGDPDVDRGTLMQFMERIHAQSIRLSQLVSDLMTISRLEADQGTSDFTRINMNELVTRAITAADSALQQKHHELVVTLPPAGLQVFGDRQNLSQLVDNLLDNAIKYTPEKGRVQVRLSQDGSEMLLEVQDSGIGISPQHQERVFERFYRVDKARSQSLGGTGLGLSIVRNIAERHNGLVSVRSQLGNGSTFSFRMPLAASNAS